MGIANLSELKAAISVALANTATDGFLQTDLMISLAEERINFDLRTRFQETTATLTTVGGAVQLPEDFLSLRSLGSVGSPAWDLTQLTPSNVTTYFPYASDPGELDDSELWDVVSTIGTSSGTGPGRFYSLVGNMLRVFPGVDGEVTLVYTAGVPPLSVTNPTNWLLVKWPSVYLFGSLVQGVLLGAVGEERAGNWNGAYQNAIQQIRAQDTRARFQRMGARISGPTP